MKVEGLEPPSVSELFLKRLQRLLRLRRDHFDELNEEGEKVLDRSIFSTYVDCITEGKRTEAQEILAKNRLLLSLRQRRAS